MNIKKRLYNDFFRPSKENEYEKILKVACKHGYEVHTVVSFEDVINSLGGANDRKFLILRRDIDTADFKILRKMLALEKKYGVRCTYYFRWDTINVGLMQEIANAGGEASYHYEEIATWCYRHGVKSKEEMLSHIEEIRDLFVAQYTKFKHTTGQACLTVASHGDYINTIFRYSNKELINERVRKETGILREAYDEVHMNALTCRIADQVEMESFTEKAIAAIERGEAVIELLTHPRQWNSPFWVNLKEEVGRVVRGLWMKL